MDPFNAWLLCVISIMFIMPCFTAAAVGFSSGNNLKNVPSAVCLAVWVGFIAGMIHYKVEMDRTPIHAAAVELVKLQQQADRAGHSFDTNPEALEAESAELARLVGEHGISIERDGDQVLLLHNDQEIRLEIQNDRIEKIECVRAPKWMCDV